jgi:hypothetical protein
MCDSITKTTSRSSFLIGAAALLAGCGGGGGGSSSLPQTLVSQGQPASAPLATVTPVPSPSAFGLNVNFHNANPQAFSRMAPTATKWIRTDIAWDAFISDPSGQQAGYDSLVQNATSAGYGIIFITAYAASGTRAATDPNPAGYASFHGQLAGRYANAKVAWEIMNEPDKQVGNNSAMTPAGYAAVALPTISAIRQAAPNATIVSGGMDPEDTTYLIALANNGVLSAVDAVGLHPYRTSAPNTVLGYYANVRTIAGNSKQLWCTEWGYDANAVGLNAQANYLASIRAANATAGVPVTIWYNYIDDDSGEISNAAYGIWTASGSTRPCYTSAC